MPTIYGRVQAVEEEMAGSQVTTDATTSDSLLFVGSTVDFSEEGGGALLVLEDGTTQPVTYLGVDDVAQTVILSALLPVAVPADSELRLDPPSVERWAKVVVDEDGEAISARVPHGLFDKLREGIRPDDDSMESVSLDLVADEYVVRDVLGQEPSTDAAFTPIPLMIAALLTPVTISTGLTYNTVTGWTVLQSVGGDDAITYDPSTGQFKVHKDGYYSVSNTAVMWEDESPAAWAAAGRRAIRVYYNTFIGSFSAGVNVQDATTRRITTPALTPTKGLIVGESIEFQVSQNSGGDVDLVGDSTGTSSFVCIEFRGPK